MNTAIGMLLSIQKLLRNSQLVQVRQSLDKGRNQGLFDSAEPAGTQSGTTFRTWNVTTELAVEDDDRVKVFMGSKGCCEG